MMELCPDDEEASCFFVFFFLQRLPAWLRIQLEGDDQDDIRRLATKADRLFALHGHKHSGAVAVVESQEDEAEAAEVNAVRGAASAATASAAASEAASGAASVGASAAVSRAAAVRATRVGASSRGLAAGQ